MWRAAPGNARASRAAMAMTRVAPFEESTAATITSGSSPELRSGSLSCVMLHAWCRSHELCRASENGGPRGAKSTLTLHQDERGRHHHVRRQHRNKSEDRIAKETR